MKAQFGKHFYLPVWVFAAILAIAGCSKENLNDGSIQATGNEKSTESFSQEDFEVKNATADQNKILAQIRQGTAKYQDIERAFADGYVVASPCVTSPLGGMGYHLVNMDLVMNNVIDAGQPEALLYEPMKNGRMRLVAVEFIIPYGFWDAEADGLPHLGDQPFDDMPDFPPPLGANYQLHVWVWKNNPLGIYFPFNPNVSCEFAVDDGNGNEH